MVKTFLKEFLVHIVRKSGKHKHVIGRITKASNENYACTFILWHNDALLATTLF